MSNRLFDIVSERFAQAPQSVMLAAKENGNWRQYTCAEVWETACSVSRGLLALGIENTQLLPDEQEKIAIISPNRPEWVITDLAVQLTGAVLTPIYPTISPEDLGFILREAAVRKIFIADADIWARFGATIEAMPSIEHVFCFDEIPGQRHWSGLHRNETTPDDSVTQRITQETLATIIYTSGTTGNPKGVMLSHHNIVSNVTDALPIFTFAQAGERALSFLPLNHIFERMVTYIFLSSGIQIWYAESMDTIGDNLREVKPMVFTTVPRLLEKVYERIMAKAMELKGIKKSLFFWALNLGKRYDNVQHGSLWYRLQLALARKLIFSKWQEALGGNVKAIVSGSAALQERLIRIFTAAGITIMEGYGLTETSPVVSVNHFESEDRRIGTIGPVIRNVEVKIADDKEILVKGPNIMMGYYKRPEQSAAVMEGGWFHTGDIGEWVEGRFLKITDRKKEMFKTSGGKYVAPQVVENIMRQSPFIEQIMVLGDGRKFVSALIVPNFSQARKRLSAQGLALPDSDEALIALPDMKHLIQAELDKYNMHLGHVEQVKKCTLLPAEWTIASGALTPKLSMRRKVIEKAFSKEIEAMYD
ncbi:MAG: long-chain fatty acid--CoA ligase [Bacteroidetes bacterium]|nr:long-chain fatty acid--CoA ligase [Bacteroidota bacterium]